MLKNKYQELFHPPLPRGGWSANGERAPTRIEGIECYKVEELIFSVAEGV
jgi:hypothetical protein